MWFDIVIVYLALLLTVDCDIFDNEVGSKSDGLGMKDFGIEEQDGKLTVPELINKYGYNGEIHKVRTTDGYILEMHRINGKRGSKADPKKSVVLIMHGLLCSSADFLIIGPNNSLGYLLADQGYDVWLGNARGNRYSRSHLYLSPDMPQFWQFSWHEIGFIDVPNMIDYVLEQTKRKKLHYIGHSQGSTTFFVMTSSLPQYNDKILLMQALAPVAYVSNMNSPLLRIVARFINSLAFIADKLGINEFLPNNFLLYEVAKVLCPANNNNNLCVNVIFQFTGADPDQTIIPILLGHVPAGASTKQMIHYGQGVNSGIFRQFDHGKTKNIAVYGVPEPPPYNLTNIRAPIILHYALNDYLAHPADVQKLAESLPGYVENEQVEHKNFNHLDFLIAKDVRRMLYDKIIRNIEKY